MEWVVKIGGSLFPENAIKLVQSLVGKDVMIICGGGNFANIIREYDQELKFSDDAAHEAAILCMDIMGNLLADKVPGAQCVDNLYQANMILKNNKTPIFLPSRLIHYLDPLEHSWNVTSDSISLYISQILQAKLLIATDVDGIYTRKPSFKDAEFINEISAKKLLSFGETSVDTALSELLINFGSNCYVVNGKYPERALSIIEGRFSTKNTQYTIVRGD
ncbi:MAG: delta 1-pyrroline-5-carboxylate synthetase [Euryarchaeota archaeon]|nr:delta 1-pyrroline-5-carboxylate synthetase [Euryarchaeota archaeon]MBU4607019.1 delta 1-pyrroline-5-carboxylate synthetase [Euryarchaeota archaeon]MBV1730601.1 delta 1-pyrroline-5-carboxylate synthetase [Methanobacterium sp.]MBV1755862.1 delta 1-pyrroline-5-carboxylate synthetase [Methanobacterium sp.]